MMHCSTNDGKIMKIEFKTNPHYFLLFKDIIDRMCAPYNLGKLLMCL